MRLFSSNFQIEERDRKHIASLLQPFLLKYEPLAWLKARQNDATALLIETPAENQAEIQQLQLEIKLLADLISFLTPFMELNNA